MEMFNSLEFKEMSHGVFRATRDFGPYTLSVILEPYKAQYEIAVIKDHKFVQLPGIHPAYPEYHDDVVCGLQAEDVDAAMVKLELLK